MADPREWRVFHGARLRGIDEFVPQGGVRRHWRGADDPVRRRARRGRPPGPVAWLLTVGGGALIGLACTVYPAFLPRRDDGAPVTASAPDMSWMHAALPRTREAEEPREGEPAFAPAPTERAEGEAVTRRFGFCHTGGGTNCVVDGDTFWIDGERVRVADIDAPETHPPRCAEEARLGAAATERLRALLNAGPFSLAAIDRDTDVYGRKLRVVMRGGESLGGTLVGEGLVRWYEGGRRPWCEA